ncbi:MAG: hypothetical protein IJZ82_04850 [Lachnospiraceae bacterium]|nr:hypothetical protein [Lachnospiraceae bacterium]
MIIAAIANPGSVGGRGERWGRENWAYEDILEFLGLLFRNQGNLGMDA